MIIKLQAWFRMKFRKLLRILSLLIRAIILLGSGLWLIDRILFRISRNCSINLMGNNRKQIRVILKGSLLRRILKKMIIRDSKEA